MNGNLYFLPDYNIAQASDMGTYDTHLGQYVGYGAEPFDTVSMVNPRTKNLLSKSESLTRTTAQLTWIRYWQGISAAKRTGAHLWWAPSGAGAVR